MLCLRSRSAARTSAIDWKLGVSFQSSGCGSVKCDINLLKIALILWHNAFKKWCSKITEVGTWYLAKCTVSDKWPRVYEQSLHFSLHGHPPAATLIPRNVVHVQMYMGSYSRVGTSQHDLIWRDNQCLLHPMDITPFYTTIAIYTTSLHMCLIYPAT